MQIIIKNRDNCGKCSSKICRYGSKTGKKSVDMGLRPGKNMGGWVGFLFSGLHTPVTFLDKYPPWGLIQRWQETHTIEPSYLSLT